MNQSFLKQKKQNQKPNQIKTKFYIQFQQRTIKKKEHPLNIGPMLGKFKSWEIIKVKNNGNIAMIDTLLMHQQIKYMVTVSQKGSITHTHT